MSLPTNTLYDRIMFSFFWNSEDSKVRQNTVADILGVSPHLIGKWKSGRSKPTIETLIKISELRDVTLDWLIKGEDVYYFGDKNIFDEIESIPAIKEEFTDHNILSTKLQFSDLKGGDSRSGSRVYLTFNNEGSTIMGSRVHSNSKEVTLAFGGDAEIKTFSQAINSAANHLKNKFGKDSYLDDSPSIKSINKDRSSIQSNTPQNTIAPEDFKEIPFYSDEIAAGQPLNIRDEPVGIVVVHKDWCKNSQNMVAVRVSSTGTSMEPTIPPGAIVTIDTTPVDPNTLSNQPVAIYKKDDGATIKRLRKTARGWCGVPDNRDPEHEIIIIEDGDRIIGKVNSVHYSL